MVYAITVFVISLFVLIPSIFIVGSCNSDEFPKTYHRAMCAFFISCFSTISSFWIIIILIVLNFFN